MHPTRADRVRLVVLFSVIALLVPSVARAGDPAAAQALFDQAKELASQGRPAEACAKLEESEKLDPGMGTEFHLADCWQRLGRTASAWAMFREVESKARASGQSGRERVAHDRAEALGQFLSKIVIDGGAATAPGLVIKRDGNEVSRDQWGSPVPVDPGTHSVTARAPGKQPWETAVQVNGDGKVVRVDVPALADAPEAAVAPAPAGAAPARAVPAPPRRGVTQAMPSEPPSAEAPVVDNRGGAQRAIGWFFVGAGVAAAGASSYFWSKWADDRNANTASSRADATDQERIAGAVAGGGGAAIVLGAILVASAPSPRVVQSTDEARVRMSPWVGADRAGFSLGGSF